MKRIDHIYQTVYSELAQRTLDARFSADFPIEGRFISMESGGRRYWYFDTAKEDGGKHRRYVGPVDDPEISQRVEHFRDLKADHRSRRKLVSTLIREAYLPQPDTLAGNIIEALANAGFFRLRGVLIGTVAYQCYSALLGARLPNTAMQTGDADFAQFHSISVAVQDSIPPVLEVLRGVDPTFREIPDQNDSRFSTRFTTRSGYRVEFLTPNRGPDELAGRPAPMPALGGAAAQPLRFLDFLIREPVRAVVLHGAGISVNVPAPARFAVHKLIIASRRLASDDGTAKSRKDRLQAATLMETMIAQHQDEAIADAFMEAWDRGPAWREAIQASLRQMDAKELEFIRPGIARGIRSLGHAPSDYGC